MLPIFQLTLGRGWRATLVFAAWLVFTSGSAKADCGDYLAAADPDQAELQSTDDVQSSDELMPLDRSPFAPTSKPCHGPNCSQSPRPDSPPFDPVAPVSLHIKEVPQPGTAPGTEPSPSVVLPREDGVGSVIRRGTSIFHPPRVGASSFD
jgi:hypothetical protein